MRRIMMVLIFSLCCQGIVLAEKVTVQDRMVGGTFKTMAKAYIAAADIGKLKEKNIQRIKIMREDWFEKQYAEVYAIIKDLPPGLKEKYGVTEGMSRGRAIGIIRSLDKKKICEIIDQIPDPVIHQQFNAQFSHDDGAPKLGLMDRIKMIWAKVVAAANK